MRTVMASPGIQVAGGQPYTQLLYRAMQELGWHVVEFRTRTLIRNRPDVVHFHWPENRSYGIRDLVLLGALWYVRSRGTILALTAHNTSRHDQTPTRWQSLFLVLFDRQVDLLLILTQASIAPVLHARPRLRRAMIRHTRHGAYPTRAPDMARSCAIAKLSIPEGLAVVAFVGQLRRYKNVEVLFDVTPRDVFLIVGGQPESQEVDQKLNVLAQRRDNVLYLNRHLGAEEIDAVLRVADLVALPYSSILNSGSALLALSAHTPVLLPRQPTFVELAAEVGPGWVHFFDDRLSEDDVARALSSGRPASPPHLTLYSWDSVARDTAKAYDDALKLRRGDSQHV